MARQPASSILTADQEKALRAAGSFVDEMPPFEKRASTLATRRNINLLAHSFSTAEVADLLKVSQARIRQRATVRGLLAVKAGTKWRFPRFQFTADGEVTGWSRIAPIFPESAHPTSIAWFAQTPHSDLVVAGEAVSPIDWLAGGGSAERVSALVHVVFDVRGS
ncbi:helix-turn-helix domain-containing protein [Gordonia sp. HY285]|uniref:helix-turn-helix domain-containing protein n=1 Tax=Gordonia liuliyuniae TaxID=2911517 RepID=UPI001F3DBF6C|nr:helix-turn-helix domain-containing protein [Gordonia liuliyuniae]MCF8610201.1 helix-turn-helix domain-containing protein [Gordonia liuliyuniae]